MIPKNNTNLRPGDFFSAKEAAKFLGVSRTTLWKFQNGGGLNYYQLGGRILFDPADLKTFVESKKVSGGGNNNGGETPNANS